MAHAGETRSDGRAATQLRPVDLQIGYVDPPEGSVMIRCGGTRVLCNATILQEVPSWIQASGKEMGWITAEYAMLPRSAAERIARETHRPRGRTQEIKRLIGRSLRAGFDLGQLAGLTCIVDCDVIQADGGTRTASVTGGYVALALALLSRIQSGTLQPGVFRPPVAAVSVGVVEGQVLLDLNYDEDSAADVDANIVMNSDGAYIEIQSTSEGAALSRAELEAMLDAAESGISELLAYQQAALNRPHSGD